MLTYNLPSLLNNKFLLTPRTPGDQSFIKRAIIEWRTFRKRSLMSNMGWSPIHRISGGLDDMFRSVFMCTNSPCWELHENWWNLAWVQLLLILTLAGLSLVEVWSFGHFFNLNILCEPACLDAQAFHCAVPVQENHWIGGFDHNQCLLAQLANERVEPKGFSIAIEDDCWPPILESSLLRKQIEVCALSFNMTGFPDVNDGVIDILWILMWRLSVLLYVLMVLTCPPLLSALAAVSIGVIGSQPSL